MTTSSSYFEITGPLPHGKMAIEASAGTGKTYTLASLALRYVAEEGLTIDQLLLVTFTHSAADDLRDRVRRRFAEALAALKAPGSSVDELLSQLTRTDVALRLRRVEQALTDFDAATITTIHGFATQVLSGQGAASSTSADAELVGTEDDLITAVCTDILATSALEREELDGELPRLATFIDVVGDIRNNPGVRLIPDSDDPEAPVSARLLRRLVDSALSELLRRHQSAGTLSYSDVLTELRDLLNSSPGAIESLRRRFRVALIDEFQDTDPVQWEFLSALFGNAASTETLILVGDPKQSIYSFRGADVHTYLQASFASGTAHTTLGINWRSNGAVLSGLEALFGGATFGNDNIAFVPVEPAPENAELRLRTRDGVTLPGVSIRAAIAPELRRQSNSAREIYSDAATEAIINDLAEVIREHLETSEIPERDHESGAETRKVVASDVAVLIGANNEGPAIQAALRDRGIPAVIVRGNNVLGSTAESHWRELLTAIARPGDPERAHSAALGWFIGWSVAELAEADEEKMAALHDRLFAWATALERSGPDEFFAQLHNESHVAQRLLATPTGERDLTDLRHIGSLLRTGAGRRARSSVGLLATLDRLKRDAEASTGDDDLFARQIESDARAVQVMTVHRAKGLEFPIVCIPSSYRGPSANQTQPIYFDPQSEHRTYDLAAKTVDKATAGETTTRLARIEAQWEHLRRLYVAATRAKYQSVIWWSRTQGSGGSGLSHVLFAREHGTIAAGLFHLPSAASPVDPAEAKALIDSALAPAGDAVSVSIVGIPHLPVKRISSPSNALEPEVLQAAVLSHVPDRSTGRLSFSAITARTEHLGPDSHDDSLGDSGGHDESSDDEVAAESILDGQSDLLLGSVRGSTQFGNLVHNILQRVDFSSPDLDDLLLRQVVEQRQLTPWDVSDEVLVAGLRAAIDTPLGVIASGRRLRDFVPGDHLNEVTFELRFANAGRGATVRDVGAVITRHLAPDDPFSSWARQLAQGLFEIDLSGHLTGSIDLVLRVRGDGTTRDRFVICDYKTNRLGPFDRESRSLDYNPTELPAAMLEHHYPLQALLYSVALHRYLRWRVRDYDPTTDLGGAAYLFIRGMAGPTTPIVDGVPHGVFPWNIPSALIVELSDLFETGTP